MSHLQERKMAYFQHMFGALEFSVACTLAAFKASAHAIYPEWFPDTSQELDTWVADIHRRANIDFYRDDK